VLALQKKVVFCLDSVRVACSDFQRCPKQKQATDRKDPWASLENRSRIALAERTQSAVLAGNANAWPGDPNNKLGRIT
jgi:hypothetical protein